MSQPPQRSKTLFYIRVVLWALVIVMGAASTFLYFFAPPQRPSGLTGASFELASTKGGSFTEEDLSGTPSLIFFGYTFCPDVCPTTLAESVAWRQDLGLEPDELRIVFVTVDPERDTLENLETYLGAFDEAIIGLRGNAAQTEAVKQAFGVVAERVDDPAASEYLVNHTASVFMIDSDGQFFGTIAFGEGSESAEGKIDRLIGA